MEDDRRPIYLPLARNWDSYIMARGELSTARVSAPERYIRGHELPIHIVTFDGLTLPYGELGL